MPITSYLEGYVCGSMYSAFMSVLPVRIELRCMGNHFSHNTPLRKSAEATLSSLSRHFSQQVRFTGDTQIIVEWERMTSGRRHTRTHYHQITSFPSVADLVASDVCGVEVANGLGYPDFNI